MPKNDSDYSQDFGTALADISLQTDEEGKAPTEVLAIRINRAISIKNAILQTKDAITNEELEEAERRYTESLDSIYSAFKDVETLYYQGKLTERVFEDLTMSENSSYFRIENVPDIISDIKTNISSRVASNGEDEHSENIGDFLDTLKIARENLRESNVEEVEYQIEVMESMLRLAEEISPDYQDETDHTIARDEAENSKDSMQK